MPTKAVIIDNFRFRFPALFGHKKSWDHILLLIKQDKIKQADEFSRQTLLDNLTLRVRNKIAVRHRIERREYLKWQVAFEDQIKDLFDKMGNKVGKIILKSEGEDGKIPLTRIRPIMNQIDKLNKDTYRKYNVMLHQGIRTSIKFGFIVSMNSAQEGLEFKKKIEESNGVYLSGMIDIIEADKKAIIAKTSTVFKTIFDRVKKRRLKKGLFINRGQKAFQFGHELSQAVWDLRNDNLSRLRRTVSSGIAQGRSARRIASDTKSMVNGVGLPEITVATRPGVYKSAFKNALRMARAETNNAYHEAEIEYAMHKGYKKLWNLAFGHLKADICDPLAGKIYDADKVPALPHPGCSCFLTTVIPGIS